MPSAETYHLTWTCYGQWLHGDARGWVDRKHHTPGSPYPDGDPQFYNASANEMSDSPCWLTEDQRRIATAAIREACRFRNWDLLAINVQPDHVHVLVDAKEMLGKRARQVLKDRGTQALRATDVTRRRWWTEGGKIEVVRDDAQWRATVDYVNTRQKFPLVE